LGGVCAKQKRLLSLGQLTTEASVLAKASTRDYDLAAGAVN
jgi:hypothetical protein